MPSQLELRHNALERRALANLGLLWDRIVDLHGRPVREVTMLSDNAAEHYPRINQIRFLNENGGWVNYGSGTKGEGIIALIEWLGHCTRPAAIEFLEKLVGDLNSTPVAAIPGRAF